MGKKTTIVNSTVVNNNMTSRACRNSFRRNHKSIIIIVNSNVGCAVSSEPLLIRKRQEVALSVEILLPRYEGCKEAPTHIMPRAQFEHTGRMSNIYFTSIHQKYNKILKFTLLIIVSTH